MNNPDFEKAQERYEIIAAAIKAIVNTFTDNLTPEEDRYVRDKLNDEQRYWRD
jgi:hypothetical protein